MLNLKVIKRSGELVDFDAARIHSALQSAFRATGEAVVESDLERYVLGVCSDLEGRFQDFYPNVENIQDIVEKHLVLDGRYQTAKAYILYRADRQRARDAARQETAESARLGRLSALKRDGRRVLLNVRTLEANLRRACAGLGAGADPQPLLRETLRNSFDGISTAQIERALILAASAFIERDPAYSRAASRLLAASLYKEVFGRSVRELEVGTVYRQAFRDGIELGIGAGLLDERLRRFDLDLLAGHLVPERDDELEYLGLQTLADRYFARLEGRRLETPQAFWMRVAMGLALEEAEPDGAALRFYDRMSRLLYLPSTPTLFHAGLRHPQLSSCYLTTVEDDLDHIFKCLGDNARLSKWSGGLGNDWTNIRATGAAIRSTQVESQGVIPFLKIANDVTLAINRSGKRRGAACAYLETWHYDIEDFLDLRKNTGDERRRTHDMNTANWIPDLFLKRVEADAEWTLFSPDEVPDLHSAYGREFERRYVAYEAAYEAVYEAAAARGAIQLAKRLPARQLWRKMLTVLFETGHPWITFKDACNVRSPQDHAGVIHSSNLCTEITLNTSSGETAVCNLGSINLARHLRRPARPGETPALDTELLAETTTLAMRMLDNVIDLNFYPTPEAKASNLRHRPVGLGVMGFQDALFELGLEFDSPESRALADEIGERVAFHALTASADLARERGAYESFPGSKWSRGLLPLDTLDLLAEERGIAIEVDRTARLDWDGLRATIQKTGLRNSNTMAIAPTATIANIAGCFPSIEPIFTNLYVKANITGEFTIINRHLVRDLQALGLWDEEMLAQLKFADGDVERIEAIPEALRRRYRGAFAIGPDAVLDLAALRGKWIDQSQSINLFLRGASGRQLSEIYLRAWRLGLKTTYYLRTQAASQVEKATLDAARFGFTQLREEGRAATAEARLPLPEAAAVPLLCRIDDPECEACQ